MTADGWRRRRAAALLTVLGLCSYAATAEAKTWYTKAQQQLTCSSFASDQDRAALGVTWGPTELAAGNAALQSLQRYVTGVGTRAEEQRFRYLSLLAAFAYLADYSNDQNLRMQFDGAILSHAADAVNAARSVLMTQILLCTHTRLIGALLESGQGDPATRLAGALAVRYQQTPLQPAVLDWPLLEAMRLLSASPRGLADAMSHLKSAAVNRAQALEASDPHRAARFYTHAATLHHLGGASKEAFLLASRGIMLVPEADRGHANWWAFPAIYDAVQVTQHSEPPTPANLTLGLLQGVGLPQRFGDHEQTFAILVRLTEAYRDLGRDNTDLWALAMGALMDLNHDALALPSFRTHLIRLASATDQPVDALLRWQGRRQVPATPLGRAEVLFDFLLEQKRQTLVTDVRTQLVLALVSEAILYDLSRMNPADARQRQAIDDLAFRVLQLDSFTRVSLAAASAGLQHVEVSPDRRFHLQRFFTYSTSHSAWVGGAGLPLVVAAGSRLPATRDQWQAFRMIATFYNETTLALDQFYDFLRSESPAVAAMAIPHTTSLTEFQQRLRPEEAVVASALGNRESYVWGIRRDRVSFERSELDSPSFTDAVAAVRSSVTATGSGNDIRVPPFEAGVAHELYRATVARVASSLSGARHIYWYGDGALGALPPAILVSAAPARAQPRTRAEFAGTAFLADDYSLSSVADLYFGKTAFLKPPPDPALAGSFAGFGAPLLSREELVQETLSRSFELAGGTRIGNLRSLAKLPAARDELTALETMFSDTLVWLGEDADEVSLKAAPLDRYRVLAFATHGFTPADVEGQIFPSLLMAPPEQPDGANDGLLTTLEIGELKLNADLVLLSACNTATSDGRPSAEAFSGLAQAFMVAGARSLLVSHWPVASSAATDLSVPTVRRWLDGAPLADSLRDTVRQLRENAATDLEAHPFFWGPFVLADDGASGVIGVRTDR
jgi:CHAT domain-containing protein